MSAPGLILVFSALLALEAAILYLGQRRLFWLVERSTGSRFLAYVVAMPGTVLHELAHVLACLALGVPVGRQVTGPDGRRGRVELFRPRRDPRSGALTLGQVTHGHTDPLRGALIAVAPVVLVPLLLSAITLLLLGGRAFAEPVDAFVDADLWKQIVWSYVVASCGQGAFPSQGDRIGAIGAALLLGVGGLVVLVLLAFGGTATLVDALRTAVIVLALPAGAAVLIYVLASATGRARG